MDNQFYEIYDEASEEEFPATVVNNKVYILNDSQELIPPKKYLWRQLCCTRKKFYAYTNKVNEETIRFGIFDLSSGAIIVYPEYEEIVDFYDNMARMKLHSKYGFLDTNGNVAIEATWDYADVKFSEDLCVVKDKDKYGYINSYGQIKIPLKYDWAERFRPVVGFSSFNRAARVEKDGKYGFITTKGEFIIY